jgi:fluoride ion exporter CrcB/FEX
LLPPRWSIALISGLCGALTSFSTAVILVLEQLGTLAVGTVLQMTGGSVGCWMLATFGGLALGNVLNPAASRRDTPDIDTMSE